MDNHRSTDIKKPNSTETQGPKYQPDLPSPPPRRKHRLLRKYKRKHVNVFNLCLQRDKGNHSMHKTRIAAM